MTARWHLGPITGGYFWWVIVTSPELLVFLFFMITDPKTIPSGRFGRRLYAVGIGLLATLLIAPQQHGVRDQGRAPGVLAIACAVRALLELAPGAETRARRLAVARAHATRRVTGAVALAGAAAFVGLLLLAGIPARTNAGAAGTDAAMPAVARLPQVTIGRSTGVQSQIGRATATQIARDVVADLHAQADALRLRDGARASAAASGAWLAGLQSQIRSRKTREISIPTYSIDRIRIHLEPGKGQAPPTVVAVCRGSVVLTTYGDRRIWPSDPTKPAPFVQTFDLQLEGGRFRIVGLAQREHSGARDPRRRRGSHGAGRQRRGQRAAAKGFASVRLKDVAKQVGIDFRQGSFRYGVDRAIRLR